MSTEREMTLDEWCAKLPDIHTANVELKALQAALQERDAEIVCRTDIEATLIERANKATRKLEAQRKVLEQALARMDRARDILTDGEPRPECNWGMLDTSDLRHDITAIQEVLK